MLRSLQSLSHNEYYCWRIIHHAELQNTSNCFGHKNFRQIHDDLSIWTRAKLYHPHPLDYRYLEDFIEDVEDNGQIKTVRQDMEIIPGINVMNTPAHTPGDMTVFVETHMGRAAITGFRVIDENFDPPKEIRAMEMDVIPPGTHVDTYKAYDIMAKVKEMADLIIPLHEPRFACMETIPS